MRVSSDCDFFFSLKILLIKNLLLKCFRLILNLQNIRVIEAHSGKTEDYFILFTGLLNTAKYILHRNSIQWNIEDHP